MFLIFFHRRSPCTTHVHKILTLSQNSHILPFPESMGCAGSKPDIAVIRPSLPHRRSDAHHHHLVSLTSSTLGLLDIGPDWHTDFPSELDEAKSSIVTGVTIAGRRIIPRTPTVTPPNEPETIDTWELMEGLSSPFTAAPDRRSFSFCTTLEAAPVAQPMLVPSDPSVKARVRAFQERIDASKSSAATTGSGVCGTGGGKVVLYFTSLRVVRETYVASCWVRAVLRGYRVRLDERDVSMDRGFKAELRVMVTAGASSLPRVFVEGRCLGGVEEVRRMHEAGELRKALSRCEVVGAKGRAAGPCGACQDVRFVPCGRCSGSCKVYVEQFEVVEKEEEVSGGFRQCPDCNENGIVRCPICC